jgi:hypothetical protein
MEMMMSDDDDGFVLNQPAELDFYICYFTETTDHCSYSLILYD